MIFGGELVIFICLNQDFQDLRIYGLRHASLSGCCWMIFGGELVIFLSESGFPGFEDLWLTPRFAIRMLLDDFWWGVGDFSGCF
jgi:hypothetical protein